MSYFFKFCHITISVSYPHPLSVSMLHSSHVIIFCIYVYFRLCYLLCVVRVLCSCFLFNLSSSLILTYCRKVPRFRRPIRYMPYYWKNGTSKMTALNVSWMQYLQKLQLRYIFSSLNKGGFIYCRLLELCIIYCCFHDVFAIYKVSWDVSRKMSLLYCVKFRLVLTVHLFA